MERLSLLVLNRAQKRYKDKPSAWKPWQYKFVLIYLTIAGFVGANRIAKWLTDNYMPNLHYFTKNKGSLLIFGGIWFVVIVAAIVAIAVAVTSNDSWQGSLIGYFVVVAALGWVAAESYGWQIYLALHSVIILSLLLALVFALTPQKYYHAIPEWLVFGLAVAYSLWSNHTLWFRDWSNLIGAFFTGVAILGTHKAWKASAYITGTPDNALDLALVPYMFCSTDLMYFAAPFIPDDPELASDLGALGADAIEHLASED